MAGREKDCRRRLVCRVKFSEWVKRPVGGCGLSGQVWRVGQEACRWYVVCRGKIGEWVKGIVDGVWSVGSSLLRGSRELSAGVVCRDKFVAWVKRPVGDVWSVDVKRASEPKKPHISYASNVANRHSDQNCQNPQNMIHLL